jgi:hypothetical protein
VQGATAGLPFGESRKHWGKEALKAKDEELASLELLYSEPVRKAAGNLLRQVREAADKK